jgi:hypothetical protein
MSSSDKAPRIALCMYAFNSVDFSVHYNHIWCIAHWANKHDFVFCGKKGLDAADARNRLVERAIELECTHLLFLDADHMFPLETVDFLLELKDEAMVSGLVCRRGNNYTQVGYQKQDGSYIPVDLPLDGRQYQVAVCAFGCTLISMHHLLKLKKPWFRDICMPASTGIDYNFRSDVLLCDAFNEIGEKCFIDTRILVGHHGFDRVVYPQNAKLIGELDAVIKEHQKLRKDQEGVYYDAL